MTQGPGVVVVTGGAGFLGSHVCERLVERGAEVLCIDNLATGDARNVAHLRDMAGFRSRRHDVSTPFRIGRPVRAVLHLASPASPRAYLAHPIETMRTGALGTFHALDVAREHGAVFLLASTSEVYGDPKVDPQPESYLGNVSSTGPRSVYDESKRFAEAAATAYHRAHGLGVRIARIFNSYGPRMGPDDGRVISTFVRQALDGEPLTVFGDGSQTRSFCYVDDTVDGLLALLASSETEPVNIGNPDARTIIDLARTVIAVVGSSSTIAFEPLPTDDPQRRRPDITRARRKLGWFPRTDLETGIRRTAAWLSSHRAEPAART